MKHSITLISLLVFSTSSLAEMTRLDHQHLPFSVCGEFDQVIEHESFITAYNYETKNPDWSAYHLTKENVNITRKRVNSFREDKSVPSKYRASLNDYRKSGYDRGHLAPNAALDQTPETQAETFLLSNMVPQKPGNNRYGWKDLEGLVRDLVNDKGEAYVITGVTYDAYPTFIGDNVEVPDSLYKIIYTPLDNDYIIFDVPNEKFSIHEIEKYITTEAEIESKTDYDFFCEL